MQTNTSSGSRCIAVPPHQATSSSNCVRCFPPLSASAAPSASASLAPPPVRLPPRAAARCIAIPPHDQIDAHGDCRRCFPATQAKCTAALPTGPSPAAGASSAPSRPRPPDDWDEPRTGRRSAARALDAICYLFTGVFSLVGAAQVDDNGFVLALFGLGCLAYGAYIAMTRGSYWVTSITYFVPLVGLALLFSR